MQLKIDEIVENRYKIMKLLNEGGMSYIYSAIDLKLNSRLVAIKLLKKQYITNAQLLQHEAMTLTKLKHPYLPTIFDFFTLDAQYEVIVMEYIEGVTLLEICSQLNSWSKIKILAQTASALSYLHELATPIVHRDIKPSNIMIDPQLNVKIIDFGISAYSYKLETSQKQYEQQQFGTPTYMAPELLAGEEVTYKADLYSFAILMIFMWDKDLAYLIEKECNIEFFVSQQFKHEHYILKQLLLTMLQSKPLHRTLTFKEVENQLNLLLFDLLNYKEETFKWVREHKSFNIAVLNLNKQAGATSVAISLTQHLSQMKNAIAYIELTDDYANVHLSYLRAKNDSKSTEQVFKKAIDNNMTFYFNSGEKEHCINKQLIEWQTITSNHNGEVIILDLSSLRERFTLITQLLPIHLLVVVTSPDLYVLPESKIIDAINKMRSINIPIIHIANKQVIDEPQSVLHKYVDITQYEQLPYIHSANIVVDLMNGRWLHPRSKLTKAIKRRLNKLNFFYNA